MKSTRRMGTYQPKVYFWKKYQCNVIHHSEEEVVYIYDEQNYEYTNYQNSISEEMQGDIQIIEPPDINDPHYRPNYIYFNEQQILNYGATLGENFIAERYDADWSDTDDSVTDPNNPDYYPHWWVHGYYSYRYVTTQYNTISYPDTYEKGNYIGIVKYTDNAQGYPRNGYYEGYWYELQGG